MQAAARIVCDEAQQHEQRDRETQEALQAAETRAVQAEARAAQAEARAAQLEEADGAHTRRGWHGRGLDRIVWLVRSECRQRNIIAPVGRALGRPLYIDCNCLNSKVLSQLGLDDSHHVHHALRQWYRHRRLVEPWYPAGYV